MRHSVLSRLSSRVGRLGVPALLLIVVALATLHASQPLHLHRGANAGLFNEEHVLAALDSVIGDAPLPDCASGLAVDVESDRRPLTAATDVPAPAARASAPRAPPLA